MSEWFVVNVADAPAFGTTRSGAYVAFEPPDAPFADFGMNIHVLQPGQVNGKYHAESVQESFLVLGGECLALVQGEERVLRRWDFLHCPAGTMHIFVGAGDGPCAILMVGARRPDATIQYPVSEMAARHGASVTSATDSPKAAYADWPETWEPATLPWPPG